MTPEQRPHINEGESHRAIRKRRDLGRGNSKWKSLRVRDCLVSCKQANRDKRSRNNGNTRETVQLHYERCTSVTFGVNKGKQFLIEGIFEVVFLEVFRR